MVLRPYATVTGRLVADGPLPPRAGVEIVTIQADTPSGWSDEIAIDTETLAPDGRFRVDGLPPGGTYSIRAKDRLNYYLGKKLPGGFEEFHLVVDLKLETGQVVDLGTFDAKSGKRVEAPAAKAEVKKPEAADMPITGRIVDLEGRPIAGVTVTTGEFRSPTGADLTPWLEGARQGKAPWTMNDLADWHESAPEGATREATTDRDGRFRLRGIPPERLVALKLAGDSIARTTIYVATRKMDPILARGFANQNGPGAQTIYGAEFIHSAAPGRPFEGVVKDADTGKPLADTEVRSYRFAGSDFVGTMTIRTKTDGQGRFRLVGLPKGEGNELIVVPNDEQPYLMQEVKLPDPPGVDPVAVEVALKRGVWIEGTLTEQGTGKPVAGAWLHYFPFRENTFAQSHPAFDRDGNTDGTGFQDRYLSKADGSFRLVGLPGRAIVGAQVHRGPYLQGAGSEAIEGLDKHGHFPTYPNPVDPGKLWPATMKEIRPASDAETVHVDLQVRTGPSVRLKVVDAEDKPVVGASTRGLGGRDSWDKEAMTGAEGEARNLMPAEERSVLVRLDARKLGKAARLRQGDDAKGPVVVKLELLATIAGRVVDPDGHPVRGATVRTDVLPGGDFAMSLGSVATDGEGKFRVLDVPAGCVYSLAVDKNSVAMKNRNFAFREKVAVKPGETTDVGDIQFKRE